ncbi:uncharacterized protein KY384_002160 [Bacidia gigantensis]|uniref:uncharacterized protein n=1 Tax=Bacidia gigantensis TaxID=2732470 RepID=UPI001D058650|nr:uncharacterized protein KY384_002160 [Bacidia gigantensis]KAG8533377.1 hypothetical protein KY384_002160 [Bacidia gigantensis]
MSDTWWKAAVIYQIYPSSFKDTNGDGWGDLPGIISKVDYLKNLGVDILWISPIYKSPQADMGYDIADYKLIDPIYGTNEDIDVLVAELKKRDMKLMMDLVVNHTSNEHAWFVDSISSKSSPKRSWYIWKDPAGSDSNGDPLPPNNWCQLLGDANSAWTYDPESKQFYLSLFTPEQPDLNWETPEVRAAVHDAMRFWLDKGVCGYRMDVINLISKDQRFPDAPVTNDGGKAKYHPGSKWYTNGPRMHEFLREVKREVLAPYKAVTVGEMPGVSDPDEVLKTVHQGDGELSMIFIFDVVDVDFVPGEGRLALRPFKTGDWVKDVVKWQRVMWERDGWNSVFIENHDNPRSVSRYCDDSDEWREKGAKLLALMQTTLSGTIFVYQGEEIGVRNMPKYWDGVLDKKARDHARTPMHWDGSPHGGFCGKDVKPWMRVMDDYVTFNVDVQTNSNSDDDLSIWQYWQRGLSNRKAHADAFVHGEFQSVDNAEGDDVFAYLKVGKESGTWVIVLNFSGDEVQWRMPSNVKVQGWVAGNYLKGKPDKPTEGTIGLRPFEGLLGRSAA